MRTPPDTSPAGGATDPRHLRDPARVAWQDLAAGRERAPAGGSPGRRICARCGAATGRPTPVGDAVSKNYANFIAADRWKHPASAWLCEACAWAYTDARLRRFPVFVRQDGTCALLARTGADGPIADWEAARDLLAGRPLARQEAITLPLIAARHHLLPKAQWGHVTTGAGSLAWTDKDRARLLAVEKLRAAGITGPGLRSDTVLAPGLKRPTRGEPDEEFWRTQDRWQQYRMWPKPYRDLAVVLTQPPPAGRAMRQVA